MTETIHRTYPIGLSPEAFLRAIASEAVIERRAANDGLGTTVVVHEILDAAGDLDGGEPQTHIVLSTDVPMSWLPPIVASRLEEVPRVVREERWARGQSGVVRSPLTFEFPGMPVTCTGEGVLRADGAGSVLDLVLRLRVDVPLVGRLVERAVAPRMVTALDAEAAFYATL